MCENRDGTTASKYLSRRRLILTGATALGVGLAGCSGGSQPGDTSPTDDPSAERERTQTAPPSTETPSLDEPVVPSEEDRCTVCNMMPAKFPEWNAQLTFDKGGARRVHFCSPGCLTAFHVAPGEFVDGASLDDVASVWARDYATGDLTEATTATWVLETNSDRIDAPMMRNPLPFAAADDAVAYVDRYDDLTRHDVVGFAAFDVPLARTYRPTSLPETDEPSVLDPAAVPDDASCAVCEMMPAKFPAANGQLTFEDGTRAYVCSPGCLTAYYADPGNFQDGRTQDDVVGAWAHDYWTGNIVDAHRASFVLETDADRIDLPMMTNPVPFETWERALAYVDRYDDLSESDVVPLSAFTVDLASRYRGKFF